MGRVSVRIGSMFRIRPPKRWLGLALSLCFSGGTLSFDRLAWSNCSGAAPPARSSHSPPANHFARFSDSVM